jgi:hypothetical protein
VQSRTWRQSTLSPRYFQFTKGRWGCKKIPGAGSAVLGRNYGENRVTNGPKIGQHRPSGFLGADFGGGEAMSGGWERTASSERGWIV